MCADERVSFSQVHLLCSANDLTSAAGGPSSAEVLLICAGGFLPAADGCLSSVVAQSNSSKLVFQVQQLCSKNQQEQRGKNSRIIVDLPHVLYILAEYAPTTFLQNDPMAFRRG